MGAAAVATSVLMSWSVEAAAQQSLTGGSGLRLIPEGPRAPEVAFQDAAGRYVGFVELRGKLVLAVFWATWCPVCAGEMPKLDRLQADLGEKGLLVAALSQDRGGADVVERYYAARNIHHLRPFIDPESIIASLLGIRGVPTTFVIDPSGRIVGVVEGAADWNSPQVYTFLQELLEQADGSTDRTQVQ